MSKIEVNTIDSQCGSALQIGCSNTATIGLGKSGDTITIPCGATIVNSGTQTGFGRTGTVDWVTTPKVTGDSPITAATGSGYFLNTTAGTITVNLPAGAAGSIVSMADYAGTWQTNNVTVSPNGSEKLGGAAAPAILNTEGQSVTFVYVDSTQGWVNTMDSTSNVRGNSNIIATVSGACNTLSTAPDCADTKIATFLNPGTFCVSQAAVCAADNVVSYMVVAGGGGGGRDYQAGGGGAGGFREIKSPSATGYTASPLDGYPTPGNRITISASPGAYPIVVGGGGATGSGTPACGSQGVQGDSSSGLGITSAGGGAGGAYTSPAPNPNNQGGDGGSGGGAGRITAGAPGGSGNIPSVTPAQGTNGGTTSSPYAAPHSGGGGGGATVAGTNVCGSTLGAGGDGATTSISATPTAYAGGGGGGGPGAGTASGGTGGGGAGKSGAGTATAGTINTGGGGGGSGEAPAGLGGIGGSGIVIIRYKFQ